MEERDFFIKRQKELQDVHAKVKEELLRLPGVVAVGIGLKERAGARTKEPCFRVYVSEKRPLEALAPEDRIPDQIMGFPTDVLVRKKAEKLSWGEYPSLENSTKLPDSTKYRPIRGGISINNSRFNGGYGTLGCIVKRNSDGANVMLSNHHVLFSGGGKVGTKVGQANFIGCFCCAINEVGVVADGKYDTELDCAIATINEGIIPLNEIVDAGEVTGVAPRIVEMKHERVYIGETVHKRGATTGWTSGIVVDIAYDLEFEEGKETHTKEAQILIETLEGKKVKRRYDPYFSYKGDSGSVILNLQNEVVGLLWGGNKFTGVGIATHIELVMDALDISIEFTEPILDTGTMRLSPNEDLYQPVSGEMVNGWGERASALMGASEVGKVLRASIETHQEEVLRLINFSRPVKVLWHRNAGPAFVAALARAVRSPEFRFPKEIKGVSLQRLVMQMAAALQQHGSKKLAQAVEQHVYGAMKLANSPPELNALFDQLRDPEKKAEAAAGSPLTDKV